MTDWLATILIVLPLGAALIVWLLPLADRTVASLALLAALVEIGVWINALTRFDFGGHRVPGPTIDGRIEVQRLHAGRA